MSDESNALRKLATDHAKFQPETGSPLAGVWMIAAGNLLNDCVAELNSLDPDPVVCGCRSAECPHTPIAKLPRQELVTHFRGRIATLQSEIESLTRDLHNTRELSKAAAQLCENEAKALRAELDAAKVDADKWRRIANITEWNDVLDYWMRQTGQLIDTASSRGETVEKIG